MSGSADPFAWLGLLQWSLKYSDGTQPSSGDITPMSAEDKAFLEKVMKEGIIDENERMKTILYEVTQQIEVWKTQSTSDLQNVESDESVDTMYDLLQELRDIVEQIDYARAFMSMKGIVFLLGCIENKENIYMPMKIRQLSCAIIATLCQHNPPVQKECIELGAIKVLYNVLYQSTTAMQNHTTPNNDTEESTNTNALFCERIIQAISAIVRSYDLAETLFCQLEQANDIFRLGSWVSIQMLIQYQPH
jgi:hsp70-interacting protein